MRPSRSASFKDQVRSLTFRVVCYTGEPDPSRLAWKFTVSWSLYSVKPDSKMSILFKATLYVCSHDHSYIDIRGVQCCKTTDLSVQMNWAACNTWLCTVLAHIEIDYPGQAGWGHGAVGREVIDVLINMVLQSFQSRFWLSALWLPKATTFSLRALFILPHGHRSILQSNLYWETFC